MTTSSILEADSSSPSSSPPSGNNNNNNNNNSNSNYNNNTQAATLWDHTHYPSPPKQQKLIISLGWTGEILREKIADELGYTKDAFVLSINNITVDVGEERTLDALGVPSKARISVSRKNGAKEEDFRSKKGSDIQIATSSSTALVPYGPTNYGTSGSSISSSSSSSSSSNWNYSRYNSKPAGKSATGFVGLSNQGATCYMNSLIQTLYMTPEFRAAVYRWSFEDKYKRDKEKEREREREREKEREKEKEGEQNGKALEATSSNEDRVKKERTSIALQLQRLFARLQLCDIQAAKTKDLTKSFGWEDSDAFTQHDVQELCRVLFDALEKNFAGTDQANFVNELYQGKMKDYVQCKECNNESARTDEYLDIPLVIKGFGETRAVESVEEALHKFVQPETLDGDNQYNCEKCGKKVDAIKGLKFVSFPYLLTLQLKRFDFDPTLMRRTKLNDKVTFPHYLDLNPFVSPANGAENNKPTSSTPPSDDTYDNHDDEIDVDDDIVSDGYDVTSSLGGLKRRKRVEDRNGLHDPDVVDDFEGPPPVLPTPEKPYIYELFSILIHRGSTMGGHYYAYIKSFENNKWYEFNDAHVSEINAREIRKAFGGDEDTPSYSSFSNLYKSTFKSTSNAYMLMYRQVDSTRNVPQVPDKVIPQSARDIIDSEAQQAKDKRENEEKEKEMVKLKVYYDSGGHANNSNGFPYKEMSCHKSATLEEATKQAADLWGFSEKFATHGLNCVRLRMFQTSNDVPAETFTDQEHKTLEELRLYSGYSYNMKYMIIETREPTDEEFREYDSSELLFKISKYDPLSNTFSTLLNVYVPRNGYFFTLRETIQERLGIPLDRQRIYRETSSGAFWNAIPAIEEVNLPDELPLRSSKINEPEKYWVEDCEDPNSSSPAKIELERLKNLIEVKFNVPDKPDAPEESVTVDKNITIKEFRDTIQPIVGLGVNEFKIKRPGSFPQNFELTNDADSLADCSIKDGMSLIIEKGRPLKEGESTFTIFLFEPEKDCENIVELFDIILDETSLVGDLKKEVAVRLQEELRNKKKSEKQPIGPLNINEINGSPLDDMIVDEIDADYLRLREIQSYTLANKRITKILPNDYPLKKFLVTSKKLAVQILSEPETATDRDNGIFVQYFKPSTYELSKKYDVLVRDDMPLDDLRIMLADKFNISSPENVGLAAVTSFSSFYDDPEVLEIPRLSWDRPLLSGARNIVGDLHFRQTGGALLLVRDNTEPLKELTKEEQEAIEKEYKKRVAKNLMGSNLGGYWNRKEKALKIHTAE